MMNVSRFLRFRICFIGLMAFFVMIFNTPALAVGVTEGMVTNEGTQPAGTTGFIVVGPNQDPVVVTSSSVMGEDAEYRFSGSGDDEDSTVSGELIGWNQDGKVAMFRLNRMPAHSSYLPLGDAGKVQKGDELTIFYFDQTGAVRYEIVGYLGKDDSDTFMTVSKPLDHDLREMAGAPVVYNGEVVAMVMESREGNLLLPMNYISSYFDQYENGSGSGSGSGEIALTEPASYRGISMNSIGALVVALGFGVAVMMIGVLRTRRAQGESDSEDEDAP